MATKKWLIDFEQAKSATYEEVFWTESEQSVVHHFLAKLLSVDAVEVVRCKDCKYWKDSWVAPDGKTEHGYCHMEESDDVIVGRWDDDFCSYGERKDND